MIVDNVFFLTKTLYIFLFVVKNCTSEVDGCVADSRGKDKLNYKHHFSYLMVILSN